VPTSTTKPIFLPVLFHWTVVPAFTQKSELLLAFGMSGVDEAALEVRFTSTEHGEEAEPHVFVALHNCAGFASEHAYFALFDWAIAEVDSRTIGSNREVHLLRKQRFVVIVCLKSPDHSQQGPDDIDEGHFAWQQRSALPLIDACGSRPIENVGEPPGVLTQIQLQLSLLVQDQLRLWI
jgi:hypothetical protein